LILANYPEDFAVWSALVDGLFSGVKYWVCTAVGWLRDIWELPTDFECKALLKERPCLIVAILFALIAAFCRIVLDYYSERTVIRYLYGRPLETLLATWGVSFDVTAAVCAQCEVGSSSLAPRIAIALSWVARSESNVFPEVS
jgi:hypothetical protein